MHTSTIPTAEIAQALLDNHMFSDHAHWTPHRDELRDERRLTKLVAAAVRQAQDPDDAAEFSRIMAHLMANQLAEKLEGHIHNAVLELHQSHGLVRIPYPHGNVPPSTEKIPHTGS